MRAIFIKGYDSVTESVWFVPASMALLAGLLAFASVALDRRLGDEWALDIGWVWAGNAGADLAFALRDE